MRWSKVTTFWLIVAGILLAWNLAHARRYSIPLPRYTEGTPIGFNMSNHGVSYTYPITFPLGIETYSWTDYVHITHRERKRFMDKLRKERR